MTDPTSLPKLTVVEGGRPIDASTDAPHRRKRATTSSALRLVRDSCRPVIRRAFGRFELLIEMGRGGMATLYLARIQGPEHFEKLLAIKRIHEHLSTESDFVGMFHDEARIAALIHHPNVATLFDMGCIGDAHFIAMEYVHGQNLTDLMKAATRHRERLPWTHAVRIVADAAAGLHAAHTLRNTAGDPLNVVHRDVSPHNILVSYDGHVKVVDFGIAYAAEKLHHTGAGTLKGKVGYMSPEQTEPCSVDHRADIFALGVVLFEAVTISRLFQEATDAATLLKVRAAQVPSPRSRNPALPPELERIILKCLARRPVDRFDSAEELSDQLNQLLIAQNDIVPRQAVARMMSDVFYDRKKIKDQQIRIALTESAPVPLEAMHVDETSSSLLLPKDLLEVRRKARRGLLVAAVLGALVAAFVVTLFLTWRDDRPRTSRASARHPTTPAEMAPPRSTAPGSVPGVRSRTALVPTPVLPSRTQPRGLVPSVSLSVSIRPRRAKAKLTVGVRTYRGSETILVVPRSSAPLKLVVVAPGHHRHTATLMPTEDRRLRIRLKATRARPRRRTRKRRRPRAMLFKLTD